jgi:hypothetical protein
MVVALAYFKVLSMRLLGELETKILRISFRLEYDARREKGAEA